MGEKQPSVRTLPTGEKATHHPDGRLVLEPGRSLADALNEREEEAQAESETLTEALVAAADDKREAQISGNEVASDKRVV